MSSLRAKSMARTLVLMPAFLVSISEASASSLDCVREMRTMLKPLRASWRAYSLPMPSEAPVTTAQEPLGPNLEI